MKTTLHILTALAIAVQGMVYGQTQENQAEKTKKIQVTHKKTYAVIGSSQNKNNTLPKELNFSSGDSETGLSKEASLSAYNKSLLVPGNQQDVITLLAQAEEMQGLEIELRNKAATVKGEEKNKLLITANHLAKQTEQVLIQASEIKGKLNIETYQFNTEIYNDLANDQNVNDNFLQYSENLINEAKQSIKLAKEMRQEAYAMPNNASKLGTMMNAEDKENNALLKQTQAIQTLNKISVPVMAVK